MAYRQLQIRDKVRIVGPATGEGFGVDGVVVDTTSTGAKVRFSTGRFTDLGRSPPVYKELWFNQKNLIILADTPIVVPTTPAQRMGYRVGDKFTVTSAAAGFKVGTIVELNADDGSRVPLFKGENSLYRLADNHNSPGTYLSLSRVTPYKPQQEEVKVTQQFKIGDRVKVIDDDGFERSSVGKHGVIDQLDDSHLPVFVKFDDGDDDWGRFAALELVAPVTPEATTIKEKLDAIDRLTAEVRAMLG